MFTHENHNEERGLFKSIINASPDIVYIYNLTWNTFIYVNERIEKNLGYTEYEIKDLGAEALSKIIFKEDYPQYTKEILPKYQTIKGKDPIKYTLRLVHKNGKVLWFQFRDVISERKNDGTPRLVLGIVQDVTEQMLANEKIKENEQRAIRNEMRYRRLFDNAPIGMYRASKNNKIVVVNNALLKILGCEKKEEIVSRYFEEFYLEKSDFEIIDSILNRDGTIYHYETKLKKMNGDILNVLESANKIIEEATGEVYYEGIIEDITEKKSMLDEIVIAKENAENSDRLKSEFLAQISHEFRTPLSSIIGFTDMLSQEFKDKVDQDIEYAFYSIQKSGRRIINTFEHIVNISQLQSGTYNYQFEQFALYYDIIEPISKKIIADKTDENIEIITISDSKDLRIEGDLYSINQILINLIDNAIKFTINGKVEISLSQVDKCAVVEISDTGIGIDEEFLPKMFDLFSKEEHSSDYGFDGSGLGLALVKHYCKLNDISIEVKSKKDYGTNIRLKFNKTF